MLSRSKSSLKVTPCPTESVSENFPPRIPRVHVSKNCCLESTEDWQFSSEDVVLSDTVAHVSKNCCSDSTEDWKFSTEDVVLSDTVIWSHDRKYLSSHRGAHGGQEFPGKYHRGIPFEVRNTVLQARNNSWPAGTNFKSTEVLGGKYASEAPILFHRGRTQRLCWTGCDKCTRNIKKFYL